MTRDEKIEEWRRVQSLRRYLADLRKFYHYDKLVERSYQPYDKVVVPTFTTYDLATPDRCDVFRHANVIRSDINKVRVAKRYVKDNSIAVRRKEGPRLFEKSVHILRPSIKRTQFYMFEAAGEDDVDVVLEGNTLSARLDRDYAFSSAKLMNTMTAGGSPNFIILWSKRIHCARNQHEVHDAKIFWFEKGNVIEQSRVYIGVDTKSGTWVTAETLLKAMSALDRLVTRKVTKVITASNNQ